METNCSDTPGIFAYEWTELAFQREAGSRAFFIFPLSVLFVPPGFGPVREQVCRCDYPRGASLASSWWARRLLRGMEDDIFTQIGFVVLVGLAAKNAILIVEFAKQAKSGRHPRRPLRCSQVAPSSDPDDSFAFIFGVLPLLSRGAGAESATRWARPSSAACSV